VSEAGTLLITGASGLVGGRLAADLRARGRNVRVASRKPARHTFASGVEAIAWNGRNLPAEALFRLEGVVHLAGEPIFGGRLTDERRRRIRASRVESTEAIVRSLEALPESDRPPVLVCASAVGYYGSRGGQPLDERSGPGEGFLAEVCVAWEQAALAAESLGVRAVCLRIGVVLAREGGALPALALPFRLGLGGRLGSGQQWFPWIQIDDLVSLVRRAIDDGALRGPVNAVAPNPVTNAELTREVARALHRPALLAVPGFALQLALGELADELLGSRRVVPRAALERGFAFAHPTLESALRAELGGA
jgi:uncharacterized protein